MRYAVRGNRPLTELLIDRGADATVRDFLYNATPYGCAMILGFEEIAAYVAERCALDV